MPRRLLVSLFAASFALAACSSDTDDLDGGLTTTDGATDAGLADGATGDAGAFDAGADGRDAAAPDAEVIDPAAEPYRTLRNSGPSEDRIDIVFVGDGYTLEELPTVYDEHVEALAEGMFRDVRNSVTEPFHTYASFFNVHRVHVASVDSGIDEDGADRDTAFDGRDTCGGFGGACYVDAQKVHAAVDAALAGSGITADWIVVTLNSSSKIAGVVEDPVGDVAVYAGGFGDGASGGYRARELGLREIAKAFCNAGYEAVTEGAAYSGAEPPEVNLTRTATAPKWARWMGYDVRRDGLTEVDAYEGGGGYETGIFRPVEESKMGPQEGANTFRFDAVTREAIILKLYEYVPIVSSQEPEAGVTHVDPVVLYVNTSAGSVTVEWAIDGQVVPGQTTSAFGITDHARLEGIGAGTYTVTARVVDDTEWVRIEPRVGLEETVTWTVELTGS